MTKKHIVALLMLVALVVAVSGCTDNSGTSGSASGVIIKSFSPDISEIFSGDDVTFSLSVENIGEGNARNVHAKIFGLGTDWARNDDVDKSIGFLEKRQSDIDAPGGTGDIQWSVTSPANLKVDNTYTAGVRLYYDYTTTAMASVKIYNNEYIQSNPTEAQSIMSSSGVATFAVTDAPVTITLKGLARPLIYRGDGQMGSITITLSNIGQGKPYHSSEDDMTVTISKVSVNNQPCTANLDGTTAKLPRAGEKSLTCQFTLPAIDSYSTLPVEVQLEYTYFMDSSASISVLKSLYDSEDYGYSTTEITTP